MQQPQYHLVLGASTVRGCTQPAPLDSPALFWLARSRLTRDHSGSDCWFAVGDGQRRGRFVCIQPAGVGYDPESSTLESVRLLAHDGFGKPEGRSVRGYACNCDYRRVMLADESAQQISTFSKFVLREFRSLCGRSMDNIGDSNPTLDDVSTVVFSHADAAVDGPLDDPGFEQRRIEPISWVSEVRLRSRRPEAGIYPDEQQAEAGPNQILNRRPLERLQLSPRESHAPDIRTPPTPAPRSRDLLPTTRR
jgi:hypothetical protein